MDFLTKYGTIALTVIGALCMILAAIAPLTKSDADNKVLAFLRKIEAFLLKLVMPGREVK